MLRSAIVGAATVAAVSAATHGVHHPNHQRQFQERQGFGAQANFDAGDAFGLNAGVNLGNPLTDNQFFMPIIVGLGVLSLLNIATDVLGLAFGDNDDAPKQNGTAPADSTLNVTRHFIDRLLESDGTTHFLNILESIAAKDISEIFPRTEPQPEKFNIGMEDLAQAVTGMNVAGLADTLQQMNVPKALKDGFKGIADSIGQVKIPDTKYSADEVTKIVDMMAQKNFLSKYNKEEIKEIVTELAGLGSLFTAATADDPDVNDNSS